MQHFFFLSFLGWGQRACAVQDSYGLFGLAGESPRVRCFRGRGIYAERDSVKIHFLGIWESLTRENFPNLMKIRFYSAAETKSGTGGILVSSRRYFWGWGKLGQSTEDTVIAVIRELWSPLVLWWKMHMKCSRAARKPDRDARSGDRWLSGRSCRPTANDHPTLDGHSWFVSSRLDQVGVTLIRSLPTSSIGTSAITGRRRRRVFNTLVSVHFASVIDARLVADLRFSFFIDRYNYGLTLWSNVGPWGRSR